MKFHHDGGLASVATEMLFCIYFLIIIKNEFSKQIIINSSTTKKKLQQLFLLLKKKKKKKIKMIFRQILDELFSNVLK